MTQEELNKVIENFPYDEFYKWAIEMSKHNIVLISEYVMPNEFKCIWQKKVKVNLDCNRQANDEKKLRIEKLFICNNNLKY